MRGLCGRTAAAMATAVVVSGCTLSNTQVVRVRSVPPDARVWLDGEGVGATPVDVVVRKSNAEPVLCIEKNAFARVERMLPRDISDRRVVELALAGLAGHATYFGLGAGGVPSWAAGAAVVGLMTFGLARDIRSGELYSFPEEIEVSLKAAPGTPDSTGCSGASAMASGPEIDVSSLGAGFRLVGGSDGAGLRDGLRALRMGSDDDEDAAASSAPEGRR